MTDKAKLREGQTVYVKKSLPAVYDQSLVGCAGTVHTIHIDSVSVLIRSALRRLPFAHLSSLKGDGI